MGPEGHIILDETWRRVLLLQKLLEDLESSLTGGHPPPPSTAGVPSTMSTPEALTYVLRRRVERLHTVARRSGAGVKRTPLETGEPELVRAGFVWDEHVDTESKAKFDLELWERKSLLQSVPLDILELLDVDSRSSLKGETHGMGYHLHYVQKSERTTLLLLFNHVEPPTESPVLYWETHAEGNAKPVDPNRFGKKRRRKVYDVASRFLSIRDKAAFRPLKSESQTFFPMAEYRVA